MTIISVYNNTSCKQMWRELEDILEERLMDKVIIGGDLNARIGTLGAANPDETRSTKDATINEEGEDWMDLFDTYALAVLNGNFDGDWNGIFTRLGYKNQEQSTIDYACANEKACEDIQQFKVGYQHQSDHFPLEIILYATSDSASPNEWITTQKWNVELKAQYTTSLQNTAPATSWKSFGRQHPKFEPIRGKLRITAGGTRSASA